MGEQPVDLRSTFSILRRNRRALAYAAAIGAAAGLCFGLLRPPMYTSASLVLLPPAQASSGETAARDVKTQIRIAGTEVVLGPAGEAVKPPMSVGTLARRVKITAPTPEVLKVEASADTPARAEALSRAVAESELAYIGGAASSLTNAELAALADREEVLQASLDTLSEEIEKTAGRRANEDADSAAGKADATALAQLAAQQASVVLQLDQLRDQSAGIQTGVDASIIQDASPGKRPGLVGRFMVNMLLGLAAAVVIAAIFLLVFGRRDRRLRYRDEIADAVGTTVIASIRSRAPRAVAGWTSLLEGYDPGAVDSWALRQALRQLVLGESAIGSRQADRSEGAVRPAASITMVTMSDDPRALAMGPQIAAYAASVGVRTRLVIAQRHEAADALWAACSRVRGDEEVRPGLFVSTRPDEQSDEQHEVDLTIVLAVVDRGKPELLDLPGATLTILAVSAGSATAEDLARTAVKADDAGSRIGGIIVADPDNLDRTTGRLLQHERSHQVPLPSRLTGMTAGRGVRTNVSDLRRRPL